VEILLVEDNPMMSSSPLCTLKKHNVTSRVRVARDGAEGLELSLAGANISDRNLKGGPKVILPDLKRPKVAGLEVLQAIKSDPEARKIPVAVRILNSSLVSLFTY
jgi:CheY-like chemotaxis protein